MSMKINMAMTDMVPKGTDLDFWCLWVNKALVLWVVGALSWSRAWRIGSLGSIL